LKYHQLAIKLVQLAHTCVVNNKTPVSEIPELHCGSTTVGGIIIPSQSNPETTISISDKLISHSYQLDITVRFQVRFTIVQEDTAHVIE